MTADTALKLKPFKELVAMTKEKVDEAMAPIRARQVRAKAEMAMLKIDTELVNLETKVQELCTERDINLDKLLDHLDERALLQHRRSQYLEVLKQLFPDSKVGDESLAA